MRIVINIGEEVFADLPPDSEIDLRDLQRTIENYVFSAVNYVLTREEMRVVEGRIKNQVESTVLISIEEGKDEIKQRPD